MEPSRILNHGLATAEFLFELKASPLWDELLSRIANYRRMSRNTKSGQKGSHNIINLGASYNQWIFRDHDGMRPHGCPLYFALGVQNSYHESQGNTA